VTWQWDLAKTITSSCRNSPKQRYPALTPVKEDIEFQQFHSFKALHSFLRQGTQSVHKATIAAKRPKSKAKAKQSHNHNQPQEAKPAKVSITAK
jgi:hypothetical protein